MATTRLMPLHTGKGRAIAEALGRTTDYVENPDKTDGGEWVTAYECDPLIADQEFLFSKRQYTALTGRDQGDCDVIAYHLRQSFKPGETDPATANKIGYELAMSLTKGKHAFLVCTHVDKEHIHSHIIFNSTTLDCSRKFRNFWGSTFAIRKISDRLCVENGLSIIEKPNPSRGSYGTWIGGEKQPSLRDILRQTIDASISVGKPFDEFIATMKAAGCEVKQGKNLAFKLSGQQRFFRCSSLGEDYTEAAIRERLTGKRIVAPKQDVLVPTIKQKEFSLLIDIQEKIQQGYGAGFERYAKNFNLKEAAKTLVYLQENGLDDYEVLCQKAEAAKVKFNDNAGRRNAIDARLNEIAELQRHIGAYGKTLDVYRQYRDGGKDKKYFAEYEAAITAHRAAKKYFDTIGSKKLPTIKMLQAEYAALAAEKKKLWQSYHSDKEEMVRLLMAKQNVDRLLGKLPQAQNDRNNERNER